MKELLSISAYFSILLDDWGSAARCALSSQQPDGNANDPLPEVVTVS